jgi:hypothetical protein
MLIIQWYRNEFPKGPCTFIFSPADKVDSNFVPSPQTLYRIEILSENMRSIDMGLRKKG